MNLTAEDRKRVEDFFNRDNEAEGVEHYTSFNHISKSNVIDIIGFLKIEYK
jgi:hypothetical protein